jgi:hypothetical protein
MNFNSVKIMPKAAEICANPIGSFLGVIKKNYFELTQIDPSSYPAQSSE